jgi:EamA domain-containing membrane protein RarD
MSKIGMAGGMDAALPPIRKKQSMEILAYRLVFAVCFTVLFGAIAFEKFLPRQWRQVSDPAGAKSMLMEAKEAAAACSGIAFQG